MLIKTARFVKSSMKLSQCPRPDKPEFAFIGRSNVGKSSLINLLTGYSKLAKTSSTPGKTQAINHFIINDSWFLADLPGYGYAKISKSKREEWKKMIESYILGRNNLMNLFVLIDSRHHPIESDINFMNFLGMNGIPFSRVFTKTDKLKENDLNNIIERHNSKLLETWEELPPMFLSSTVKRQGKDDILGYIEKSLIYFKES